MKTLSLLISLTVLQLTSIHAQEAGTVDVSFNGTGMVMTEIGDGYDQGGNIVIQPDEKIIVAGRGEVDGTYMSVLVRYNPDGSLDESFGDNGYASGGTFVEWSNQGECLLLQGEKIVYTFTTGAFNNRDFAMVRFNSDGSMDSDFGDNGIVVQSILANDFANGIDIDNEGRLLIAGQSQYVNNSYQATVVRFTSDGILDTTFGDEGIYQLDYSQGDDRFHDLVVRPDNKIVLMGYGGFENTSTDPILVRLNDDGTPDLTFSDDGIISFDLSGEQDYAEDIELLANNKLLIAASLSDEEHYNAAVLCVNEDGSMDETFGVNGVSLVEYSAQQNWADALIVDDENRILLGGHFHNASLNFDAMVARMDMDGNLDPTFGVGGIGIVPMLSFYGTDIAIQADNKILFSGWFNATGGNGRELIAFRFLSENADMVEDLGFPSIQLYPNPSQNEINVTAPAHSFNEWIITDASGKLILSGKVRPQQLFNEKISLDGIEPGIYSIELIGQKESISKTFVVER